MSKYKAYSKGRGNSRAGLQFDRLLKVCSNSKKTPAAMAVGALGRFGVAQFTSTRSCLDSTGEEEQQEKPSRFSSLHKRPRMDSTSSNPPNLEFDSYLEPCAIASSAMMSEPPELTPQQSTVLKPRKFFKSRGPMEVEVTPQPRPLRPDVTNLIPQSHPILMDNINLIGNNHRQKSASSSPRKNSSSYNKSPTKTKTPPSPPKSPVKRKRQSSSSGVVDLPPINTDLGQIGFTSPPIKIKIVKDKLTSKFSVSDDATTPTTPPFDKKGKGTRKTKKDKIKSPKSSTAAVVGKPGRGRPPKGRERVTLEPEESEEEETKPKPTPQINPKRATGRVTRSSVRYEECQNQNEAPGVAGSSGGDYQPPVQETFKRLEEDAEFQQLSQMLSSMEDESAQQNQNQQNTSSAPLNLSDHQHVHESSFNSTRSSLDSNRSHYEQASPQYGQQQQEAPRNEQDIRSILEDDWNEFDEESPRKGHHHSTSPPKVSRFDPSAFLSPSATQSSDEGKPHQHHHQQYPDHGQYHQQQHQDHQDIGGASTSSYPVLPTQEIQRPIPVYPPTGSGSSSGSIPFNINTSPYAMKNLLGDFSERNPESESSPSESQVDSGVPRSMQSSQPESEIMMESSQGSSQQSSVSSCDSQSDSQQTVVMKGQSPQKKSTQSPAKKVSIFKSRATKSDKPTKAVYKHTFGQMDKGEEQPKPQPEGEVKYFEGFDEEETGEVDLTLRRVTEDGNTTFSNIEDFNGRVVCKKESKRFFTVVRNVKAGHELQESGEFHEFDGDVMYILEDLKDKHPINSRCLSAITLAQRCMDQAFRMHLRAHGTVAEFCKELHDAPQNSILSLLAATVLFVLSQDRLNMDLDTESLKLILALSKADFSGETQNEEENLETTKNRQKVMQLCSEMKERGHAKHLNLEKITASELALETLLYLTSKRAGEWVKHELRTLGGLNSVVDEVQTSFGIIAHEIKSGNWDEVVTERLRKIDRCLEVLGRVTFNHEDNQRYLMQVSAREAEDGSQMKCTSSSPVVFLEMFNFCKEFLENTYGSAEFGPEKTAMISEILFLLLRLLVNLSHDYRGIVLGSEIMMGMEGFLELSLHSIFEMTKHFPEGKVFDLLMHSLCLLLNLVELSKKNRMHILQSTIRKDSSGTFSISRKPPRGSTDGVELPVLDSLIQMFLERESSAKEEEQHTDNILTTGEKKGKPSGSGAGGSGDSEKDSQDTEGTSVQDTIDKLIQAAGNHMENSLIAAYISLLIAFLVMDDTEFVEKLKEMMPGKGLLPLMVVLKKLFNFMSITSSASGSTRGLKATATALKFYAKVDSASASELKKLLPE